MAPPHVAWINGRYVPLAEAALSVFDAGVTTGATVTERLRTFRHEPFLLDDHVTRLAASAEAAHVRLPLPPAEIAALTREVVRRNAALVPANDDLAVSAFATAGTAAGPTLCVHATPIAAGDYAAAYGEGLKLATPVVRAIAAESLPPQIKTRSRLHWHIADAQADALDAGAKALLVDIDGHVTETATGNLFVVTGGGRRIATPRRRSTLGGISREFAAGLLASPVEEADLTPEDVAAADESFVTSSVYCVLPVTRLNRTPVGAGPGPVYRNLLRDWSERVGVDIAGQMARMASGTT